MAGRTVTVLQASARISTSRRLIYLWMASGRLPFVKDGMTRRIAVEDLDRVYQDVRRARGVIAHAEGR